MPNVTEITCARSLETLRLPWHSLWMQSTDRQVTQSFDWFLAAWRAFGGNRQLRVLVVGLPTEPIGILPLAHSRERRGLDRQRELTSTVAYPGVACGVVGPNVAATYMAAIRHLAMCRGEWDELSIGPLSHPGEVSRCDTALDFAGLFHQQVQQDHYLELDLSSGKFATISGTTTEHSKVEFQDYTPLGSALGDGEPNWNLFDTCVEIDQSHLHVNGVPDSESILHESRRQFSLETYAAAVKYGQLVASVLWQGAVPIAYCWGHRTDNCFTCLSLRSRRGVDGQEVRQRLLQHVAMNCAAEGIGSVRLLGSSKDFVPVGLGRMLPAWTMKASTRSLTGRTIRRLLAGSAN